MRTMNLFSLCVLLTSCAAPRQATREPHVLTEPPLSPSSQLTTVPSAASPQSAVQPTVFTSLESGVPLSLWNEAQSRYEIHLVDPANGQDVPGYTQFIVSESTQFSGSRPCSTTSTWIHMPNK